VDAVPGLWVLEYAYLIPDRLLKDRNLRTDC